MLEIVRPGMEDSESVEKQENTGIGPASACRGKSALMRVFSRAQSAFTRVFSRAQSAFTRVFHALWHAPRVPSAAPERFSALRPPPDSGLVKQRCSPRARTCAAGTRRAV